MRSFNVFTKFCLTLIVFFVCLRYTYSQDVVLVTIQQPPPNQLHMEDLWEINLNNTSQNPLDVYLYGTLTEQYAGLIATATTSNINLAPGVKIVRVNELEPISIDYPNPDPRYRKSLIRTGSLPAGNYEMCVYVRFANSNHNCGFNCIQHNIEMIPAPTLIFPNDGETIVNKRPLFTWMQALRPGIDVKYNIKIVEVRENQSLEIAMQTNPSWFEEKNILNKIFQYPVSAIEFEDSIKYAWQVVSLDPFNNPVGENDGKSEIYNFLCGTQLYELKIDTVKIPVASDSCLSFPIIYPLPKMDGGLINTFTGEKKIYRDDYVPLNAEGMDYDLLIWTCAGCKSSSSMDIPLSGRIKFKWKIKSGEGSFVKVGGLPKNIDSTEGNNVIFKPPYVSLKNEDKKASGIKKTVIELKIVDVMGGTRKDADVQKDITVTTKRLKKDSYSVKVESSGYSLPSVPPKKKNQSEPCQCKDPVWKNPNDLKTPSAKLPQVEESSKLVTGEWILLEAPEHSENDILPLECLSTDKSCPGSKKDVPFEDNVQWQWTVPSGKGYFIKGFESGRDKVYKRSLTAKGRFVIYEAPQKIKGDKLDVSFFVKMFNEKSVQKEDKVKKDTLKNLITVVKPGVKLTTTPLEWLPENRNFVSLTSKLVYKDGNAWKPSPMHAGRIHYFELMNVSREPGVTLNYPIPKLGRNMPCRDLQFKDEDDHEAFNDKDRKFSSDCSNKKFYVEARTKNPENKYTIKVYSNDYGSYGFLRSFANVNKSFGRDRLNSTESQKPYFIPVPVNKDSVIHPLKRKKKKEYKDNRVTIPRDIDENHIADNGWEVEGEKIQDSLDIKRDNDDEPNGDGYNGDGLTGYWEYRGFMVFDDSKHVRTNTKIKDLFVYNPDSLPTDLFESASGIKVHRINDKQFLKKGSLFTVINFNYSKSRENHNDDQCGLQIKVGKPKEGFTGWTTTTTGNPAPPNWVKYILLKSKDEIKKTCEAKNLDFNRKLNQLVAHELAHGVNVYHHGEMENNNKLLMHGLRSGHLGCIMGYDNIDKFKGEFIGNIFCNGVNDTVTGKFFNRIYGSTNYANGRGTCISQFRISGLDKSFPKRDITTTIRKYVSDQKMPMRKRLNEIEKRLSRIRAKGDLKIVKDTLQKKVKELRSKITNMRNLDDVRNVKKELDKFKKEVEDLKRRVGG